MNERIKAILEMYNLSASKFADIVDVQASGISHILSGRNKPGYDFIRKVLIAFPEIDPDWLILGNGSMKREIPSLSVDHSEREDIAKLPEATLFNDEAHEVEKKPVCHEDTTPDPGNLNNTVQSHHASLGHNKTMDKNPEKVVICYSDKTFSVYSPE